MESSSVCHSELLSKLALIGVKARRKSTSLDGLTKQQRYKRTPKGKYQKQRERAKARGIEWQFTYEAWVAWWGEDFFTRGRRRDDLVMARIGDVGPYSPTNCVKMRFIDNAMEGLNGE